MAHPVIASIQRAANSERRRKAIVALLVAQKITRIADIDLTHPAISGLTAEELFACIQAACAAQSARCEPIVRRIMRGQRHWSPFVEREWKPLKEIGSLPPILSDPIYSAIIGQWENLAWQILFTKSISSNRIHWTLLIHCLSDRSDPFLIHAFRSGGVTSMFEASAEKHGLLVRKAMTSMISVQVHESLVKLALKPVDITIKPADPLVTAILAKIP